jgi:hypothetical protein
LPALRKLVGVLSQGSKIPAAEIVEAIRRLINSASVVVNWPAADRVISFGKKAAKLMEAQGVSIRLLF